MTLSSMTGFARSEGSHAGTSWHWEVRSVNGRGLDMRVRLPPGFEALEPLVREAVARHIARGSIAVSLNVQRGAAVSEVRLNEDVLRQVIAALERIRSFGDFERPRADTLLGLRGVLEVAERIEVEEERAARLEAMMASLEHTVSGVVQARADEGLRLQPALTGQVATIERLTEAIAATPARTPEAIRTRLKEQIARILENGQSFDETRLYQEAALLAQRADIDEELKRLMAHVSAAGDLMAGGGPTGRKLDFLTQELNREANTLCSKSNDVEVTRLGLELKAVIDQMREQVQNIE